MSGPVLLGLVQIRSLLDEKALVDEIEAGFVLYSDGKVTVPPVGFLHLDDPPGDVHIKYGYVQGGDHYVLKMASAFYENPSLGLSPADGVILVFSQKTGALEVVLHDQCWLTDMRTAAAGAVAARHLAPSTVDCIGIVGTGVQARMQLEMLADIVDCDRCLIWGRDREKVEAMIADLERRAVIRSWGLSLEAAESVEELASRSNLIVTATSAKAPVIPADAVRPGTHITAMGSDDDGKQELAAAILGAADVVVADSRSQCVHHGECGWAVREGLLTEGAIVELGEIITNPKLGRTNDHQVTVADLTGVAVQDVQIAAMVVRAMA